MKLAIASILLLASIPGCGEPERPRFIPATDSTPPGNRRATDKLSRESPPLQKIPMH